MADSMNGNGELWRSVFDHFLQRGNVPAQAAEYACEAVALRAKAQANGYAALSAGAHGKRVVKVEGDGTPEGTSVSLCGVYLPASFGDFGRDGDAMTATLVLRFHEDDPRVTFDTSGYKGAWPITIDVEKANADAISRAFPQDGVEA